MISPSQPNSARLVLARSRTPRWHRIGPVPLALAATFCLVPSLAAQFQPPREIDLVPANLPEIGQQLAGDFAQAAEMIEGGQWAEAIAILRRLAETPHEGVVGVGADDATRFVSVRQAAQMQIMSLPPEGLAVYRRQIDPLAERWFRQAREQRDLALLERIVDEMFCSSRGDDALLLLGEIALEQGRYATARRHLERIAPELRGPGGRPLWIALREIDFLDRWDQVVQTHEQRDRTAWLAYPDTDLSLADVWARLVLVSVREHRFARARDEWEAYRHFHPQAKGRLAGRQVDLVESLDAVIRDAADWPEPWSDDDWRTFGGGPDRARATAGRVEGVVPIWKRPIVIADEGPHLTTAMVYGLQGRNAEANEHVANIHPVVVNDTIWFSDADSIYAYDLATAKPAFGGNGVVHRPRKKRSHRARSAMESRVGIPRYTLTAHRNLLLARLGDPRISSHPGGRPRAAEHLVGRDLDREAALRFEIVPEDPRWTFEGTPVCDDSFLYVAMRRFDVGSQAYVACYDLQTRRRQWLTKVCSASPALPVGRQPVCNNLLTLDEDTLFYNTNLGAVAAIAARDGQIRWVSRYDRMIGKTVRVARIDGDVNPCIASRGMVILAPHDSVYIYAFDATTGLLHWKTDLAADASHLLGVVDNNLVATGDRIWLIDIRSGAAVTRPWPEGKTSIRGEGRGAIDGSKVYWPTRHGELFVFDVAIDREQGGLSPVRRIDLRRMGVPPGNVVIAGSTILIAGGREIHAMGARPGGRQPAPPRAAGNRRFDFPVFAAYDNRWNPTDE